MPSTYSPSLKLELIGTGEQAGTWGTTTNYNLGTLVEQAITGVITINMGDATYTLTNYNGLSDEARNAVLMLNGPITSPQNVIIPPQQKVYIVRNRTGNSVTLTANVGGVNVSIANAASEVVFCDGSNVYSATQFNYIDGNLTVTGNTSIGGSLQVGTTITLGGDMYGNSASGQWYVPVGNSTVRTNAPIEGLIRYNTDLQAYEGYANSNWVTFNVSREGVYSVNYFLVGGGGGGGAYSTSPYVFDGGGGGAGGYLSSALSSAYTVTPGVTYTFVVGGGGGTSTNGSNTTAFGFLAYGGGGGGSGAGPQSGQFGGSGGGGTAGQGGGASVSGQGNNGSGAAGSSAGGGGGASAAASGSNGGAGTSTSITGSAVYYCGGGGGGTYDSFPTGGQGGIGGGGNGGNSVGNGYGVAGTQNTGGGGGGASSLQNSNPPVGGGPASGGSGVVIVSIPTDRYTGTTTGSPLVSTFGNATILKYTSSGTYTA